MADEARRRLVLSRIADLVSIVDEVRPSLTAPATLDGARRHAAAAMLMRSIELFKSVLAIEEISVARPSLELSVRSIFEVTTRARFLLISPSGEDEFVRMCRDADDRDEKLAKAIGNANPGLPGWLNDLLPDKAKLPRNLRQICEALDVVEGRPADDRYSARFGYRLLYAWLSNSAAHAGLSAMKRFAVEELGVLRLVASPDPLTTHWPVPVIASHFGELALAVFASFQLDDAALRATEVHLPTSGGV